MALQVTGDFETPYGSIIPSTYWRWVGLGIDVTRGAGTLTLYAYVSEAAFAAGKQAVGQRQYEVSGPSFQTVAGQLDGEAPSPISQVVYDFVRANDPYFAGAVDV